jgi:hypothetical protein
MWNHIKKKYKVNVRRDVIMQILQEVDPDGVSVRKKKYLKRRIYHNKGPNYLWHMDGYDKLTPYGIGIHVDHTIWMYAMEKESRAIPKFYPSQFKLQADDLLQFCLNMKQSDINVENWESVYLFLINHMS